MNPIIYTQLIPFSMTRLVHKLPISIISARPAPSVPLSLPRSAHLLPGGWELAPPAGSCSEVSPSRPCQCSSSPSRPWHDPSFPLLCNIGMCCFLFVVPNQINIWIALFTCKHVTYALTKNGRNLGRSNSVNANLPPETVGERGAEQRP